jgi:hypothetical protein
MYQCKNRKRKMKFKKNKNIFYNKKKRLEIFRSTFFNLINLKVFYYYMHESSHGLGHIPHGTWHGPHGWHGGVPVQSDDK